MFKILKDNKDFFHGCKHDFEIKGKHEQTTKLSMMGVCSNCHKHKNNQDYEIF
jgi:hypothetical protein